MLFGDIAVGVRCMTRKKIMFNPKSIESLLLNPFIIPKHVLLQSQKLLKRMEKCIDKGKSRSIVKMMKEQKS